MTTFKAPPQSMSFHSDDLEPLPANNADASIPVYPPSSESPYLSRSDSGPVADPAADDDSFNDPVGDCDDDYMLIATQQQTQSEQCSYRPELEEDLVGCLVPTSEICQRFDLLKVKEDHVWKIGRHPTNDFILSGLRLSNFHCTLHWNGKFGKSSQVVLADNSTNGTWVNNVLVNRGQSAILRGGAAISFGRSPDVPNDWRFIFRDVEGQSTRHMNQIWAKYDIRHELGSGAFAHVYKCVERATGNEYAVKIIDRKKLSRSHAAEQGVLREVRILRQLADFRHKNIVSLREHFEEDDAIYLILELVTGGDLLAYIGKHGALPEAQVRCMAAQMCHAVAYIHSQGIAHRDLKPENVMVTATDPPECKVADFGLAKLVGSGTFLKTFCGTAAYLAPEVMLRESPHQGYDNRVDSWSLGVIIYCMLTNRGPFREQLGQGADAEEHRIYFGTRQINWDLLAEIQLSEDGTDFLRQLLVEDPRKRRDVSQMFDHHWISSLVPSDSQFQHPLSQSSGGESATPPTTTDGVLSCSQSFENLNLSDMTIPGLGTVRGPADMSVDPEGVLVAESCASEPSITSLIPGAFPKPRKEKARMPLAVVEEASGENASWDDASSRTTRGHENQNNPGPSRGTPSPAKLPVKRKSYLVESSSPLSPLSDEEPAPKKAAVRRAVPPRSKAVETSTGKRKTRTAPSSSTKQRRAVRKGTADSSEDERPQNVRRGTRRQPATKAPRYA